MIAGEVKVFVPGKGFLSPMELSLGDPVITLNQFSIAPATISSISTDHLLGKVCKVDSGAHSVLVTDDARFAYYSESFGHRSIAFNEIAKLTRDKTYSKNHYLPVLSWPEQSARRQSNSNLEYIARCLAYDRHDYSQEMLDIINNCSGADAIILVDMLEFWCSDDPGKGWFGRVQVKSRVHFIRDRVMREALAVVAVLAGYTCRVDDQALLISYESMPIPGSRPKNQKYYYSFEDTMVYNINASNLPILGMSNRRCFYLPCTSVLQNKL
jgi:hypothetical protein